ncbi:type III-B CRISPR module-associated Cmr3 family protein [Sulfurisphaera ohwakuensis]|uniref:CRISPR-associated protein Cmr3 n=1 Tax=Sulfurisphaera ohwakuensis TaxID=69656 RepID=A0A650CKK0_SULOH|nr:type III-B CRISPR module-associated Cmr3 family protein [Sulfurisphaera ohwakuensis]MBB5254872.1 CRISPR-associated protein Cmr3 [Sulfurisphaera ohwakuensis]QGR18278.1 CRISPR-associated protein Cmr3 [Sulfurisphaera ohwakuensis]
MYLLIRPLGSVVFKWGGYSSILISGSINTGYFEPLPMPSTIYGLLKYAYTVKRLGIETPKFKGPLFYVKGKDKVALCVHMFPQGLKCNTEGKENDIRIEEEDFERRIGIAIDRKTKITKEGYIYMEKMLDLYKLSRKIIDTEVEKYGILIEVEDENAKKLNGFIVPFGGESRPAKISIEEVSFKKLGKRLLASPAIIDKGDENHIEWNSENVKIKMVTNKLTYRLISLGFEIGKRLQIRLSLMPTVEILYNKDFVGYFIEKGWGSIIEI